MAYSASKNFGNVSNDFMLIQNRNNKASMARSKIQELHQPKRQHDIKSYVNADLQAYEQQIGTGLKLSNTSPGATFQDISSSSQIVVAPDRVAIMNNSAFSFKNSVGKSSNADYKDQMTIEDQRHHEQDLSSSGRRKMQMQGKFPIKLPQVAIQTGDSLFGKSTLKTLNRNTEIQSDSSMREFKLDN